MPRNGAGVYTLAQPAFTPQTPISSAAVNSDFSDIASAITNSIASDGQTPITGALKFDNAGFVYGSDPNTGIRRSAADEQTIFAGGGDIVQVNSGGIAVYGNGNFQGRVISGGGDLVPPGLMAPYAGGSQPTGWLVCNGAAVSRSTYAALYLVIGDIYGAGDGSTTFNIPDMRGRVAAMLDSGTGRLPGYIGLNVSGGTATSTLSTSNLPPYTPTGTVGIVDPGHPHPFSAPQIGVGPGSYASGAFNLNNSVTNTQPALTGITASFTGAAQGGSSTPVPVIQPTLAVNYIIKT